MRLQCSMLMNLTVLVCVRVRAGVDNFFLFKGVTMFLYAKEFCRWRVEVGLGERMFHYFAVLFFCLCV